MKSNSKRKKVTSPETSFSQTLLKISYRFPLAKVFDDFLTMAIAACTQNSATGLSFYEDEYLQTITCYNDSELSVEFSKALAQLIIEMEERLEGDLGNDVLGEFYEREVSHGRNGQFFTPYSICRFMASVTALETANNHEAREGGPLRILDPACGSGRMMLANAKEHGSQHYYYGIDIDPTCVKMAALNLFLNGMWHSEIMCADALRPDDFVIAYYISFLPLGIFKIEEKEQSVLWNMHRNSFIKNNVNKAPGDKSFRTLQFPTQTQTDATQLDLFL